MKKKNEDNAQDCHSKKDVRRDGHPNSVKTVMQIYSRAQI